MSRLLLILAFLSASFPARAVGVDTYIDLARQGWTYELRTTMVGRDLSIPVRINGKDRAGASLCIIGERPHRLTAATLKAFAGLIEHSFGKRLPLRYAGPNASGCGAGRTILLRLYSGLPPNRALSADLEWLNQTYRLGLPSGRAYGATSPAMGQTFFGRRGQGTHVMVKQPASLRPDAIERSFYGSILIEELFQTFTFGMDILHFDRKEAFLSKLQEHPLNLSRLSWDSREFMRGLLATNPRGLCQFDLIMLHAVALNDVDQTTEPAFIAFVEREFENLMLLAKATGSDPRFSVLMDPDCAVIDP